MTTVNVVMTNRYYADTPTTQPEDLSATCTFQQAEPGEPTAQRTILNLALTRAQADAMRYNRVYTLTLTEVA